MRITDAQRLMNLIWPQVVRIDDLFLLADSVADGALDLSQFSDLTEAEAFHNHVHILDCFEHGAGLDGSDADRGFWDRNHPDFRSACDLGRDVAAMWRAKLACDFPGERFRIYFTADDNPVVRFHLARPNEPAWLNEENWSAAVAAGRVVVLETGRHP